MAKNEYIFENTIREPSKGITVSYPAHTRTIGEGEVHLQYAPAARCLFPGGPEIGGQCLLTENKLYFVGNTRKAAWQYLEIPIASIERVKKRVLGIYLAVYVEAFEYSFTVPHIQAWMDSIAKIKQGCGNSQHAVANPALSGAGPVIQTKRFCSYCGAKIESGTVYCPECGNVI